MAAGLDVLLSPNDTIDVTLKYTRLTTVEEVKLYQEVFAEVEYRGIDKWLFMGGAQYLNYNQDLYLVRPGAPMVEAITPFVEAIIPSHQYESLAQTAVGRDLRALVVGAAAGGFADFLPGLHFQTRASYAFVERAVDIRPNRIGIDSSVGYFVTPRLAIQFIETFQLTRDGIDFIGAPELLAVHNGAPMTDEHFRNHDRLTRSNALNFGAGVAFELTNSVGVFATFTKLAWGKNLPPPRAITVGMNWSVQTRGSGSRASANGSRSVASAR